MKIIKKQDVSGWNYKYTCSNCESELEVESSDLTYKHYTSMDQREPSYDSFSVSCLVCGQSHIVPGKNIPKLIQIEAKKRSSSGSGGYFDR